MEINIFDKKLYSEHNILTSKGIQKKIFYDMQETKRDRAYKKYLLIKPEDYGFNVNNDDTQNSRQTELMSTITQ